MDRFDQDEEGSMGSSDEYEDRDGLQRTKQPLGISKAYVPRWDQSDGFREFTRIGPSFYDIYLKTHILRSYADGGVNRKDGIIASSKLNPRDFKRRLRM
jgi:hypothetical protein